MEIIEILENMALLSVGPDDLTPKTKSIFLKYINIANREIYGKTASVNPDLILNQTIQVPLNDSKVDVDKEIFSISNIYVNNKSKPLFLMPYMDFISYKKTIAALNQVDPEVCSFRKKTVFIGPIKQNVQYDLDIFYTPQCDSLTLDTLEDDIPYPKSYHDVLVDGALYYLFSDEEGFKGSRNKLEAKERKERRLNDLSSYLNSNQNQAFSTYSVI